MRILLSALAAGLLLLGNGSAKADPPPGKGTNKGKIVFINSDTYDGALIRKSDNRVRITAQLMDASTGNHRWADRYDRDLIDIFAVQDEITRNVVIFAAFAVSSRILMFSTVPLSVTLSPTTPQVTPSGLRKNCGSMMTKVVSDSDTSISVCGKAASAESA